MPKFGTKEHENLQRFSGEKLVIKFRLKGFSEEEIAELMHLKRGKVHIIKEGAILKLKEYFKAVIII